MSNFLARVQAFQPKIKEAMKSGSDAVASGAKSAKDAQQPAAKPPQTIADRGPEMQLPAQSNPMGGDDLNHTVASMWDSWRKKNLTSNMA